MQSIGMFEAKTHLTKLIKDVQKGQTYVLTNRSQEVAVIMSIQDYNRTFKSLPFDRLREIFKSKPFESADEIISMRDEGRAR